MRAQHIRMIDILESARCCEARRELASAIKTLFEDDPSEDTLEHALQNICNAREIVGRILRDRIANDIKTIHAARGIEP